MSVSQGFYERVKEVLEILKRKTARNCSDSRLWLDVAWFDVIRNQFSVFGCHPTVSSADAFTNTLSPASTKSEPLSTED